MSLRRYTLRINEVLLDKLEYIAKENDRTKNKQLENVINKFKVLKISKPNIYNVIKKFISEYEEENGVITPELIKEMRENN